MQPWMNTQVIESRPEAYHVKTLTLRCQPKLLQLEAGDAIEIQSPSPSTKQVRGAYSISRLVPDSIDITFKLPSRQKFDFLVYFFDHLVLKKPVHIGIVLSQAKIGTTFQIRKLEGIQ